MQSERGNKDSRAQGTDHSADSSGWLGSIFFSPLLWGGLLTVGFYQLIPYLPVQRELAIRYFCSHPLEYATAALFFLGIAILGLKALRIVSEKSALSAGWLDGLTLSSATVHEALRAGIEQRLCSLSTRQKRTHLARRIADVCAHLRGRQTTENLEEHLKYLAEVASERLHASYALVRTITWAVPILGFLGTVIGITIAIANVTPAQLETSLGEVTGGLAVAFDTTALALALSLVLVFAAFVVERAEQNVLADVEDFGIKRLVSLFPPATSQRGGLIEAENAAARQLLEKTERLINWQTEMWQNALESLRGRWMETLEHQRSAFEHALAEGMAATLTDHAHQLSQARQDFLQCFGNVSAQLAETMSENRQAQRELGDQWQQQLDRHTGTANDQLVELRKQGELLRSLVAEESELTRLQARLSENLEALRAADTFEETLHSLNAAVHLLTAKVKPKAA